LLNVIRSLLCTIINDLMLSIRYMLKVQSDVVRAHWR